MNQSDKEQTSRKNYSLEEITQFISQWKSSRQTVKAFCKEQQINYYSFINWISTRGQKRLQNKNLKAAKASSDFIPIRLSSISSLANSPQVELIFDTTGERRIRFYAQVDIELIKKLLN